MEDKLISMNFKTGKMIVMRTTIDENGNPVEQEIERDIPKEPTVKGVIRKLKRGEDGKFYETEEVIETPVLIKAKKEE